jgi:hypothetical protein
MTFVAAAAVASAREGDGAGARGANLNPLDGGSCALRCAKASSSTAVIPLVRPYTSMCSYSGGRAMLARRCSSCAW